MEEKSTKVKHPTPFPVSRILEDAKKMFECVLPIEYHENAVKNGLSRGLLLNVDWAPVKDVADIDDNSQISLYANFCQFLWTLSYVVMATHDCAQIMDGIATDSEISREKDRELVREAKRMFGNALLMLVPNKDNEKEMSAYRGIMYDSPNPVDKRNRFTEAADAMTVSGIAYLLQHEFGHFIKEHEFSSPKTEREADEHSFRALIEWGREHEPNQEQFINTLVLGSMMALLATAFINPTWAGQTHPDIDVRIDSLFQMSENLTGQGIPDSTYEILISGLSLWSYSNKKQLPERNDDESLPCYYSRIKEEFILPIKRTVKAI